MIFRIFTGLFIIFYSIISLALHIGSLQQESTLLAYTETDARHNSRVVLLDVQTGIQVDISSNVAGGDISARTPRWSLDGERVVFWSYHLERGAFISEISLNTNHQNNLTEDWGYLSLPIFAPSGDLGFSNSLRLVDTPFYIVDRENNETRMLLESIVGEPQWSSDGRYLAYLSRTVFTLDSAGGFGDSSSELDLYTLDTVNNEIRNRTAAISSAGIPSWSPDGKRIAFVPIAGRPGQLHIIDIESGAVSYPTDLWLRSTPLWSPDGKYLAFVYVVDMNLEIGALNLDTNQVLNISKHPSYELQPNWSPDSKYLVFISRRNRQDDLYMYNVVSDELQRLTYTQENESDPVWRP